MTKLGLVGSVPIDDERGVDFSCDIGSEEADRLAAAEPSPADGEEQPGDQRENESDERQEVHQSANRVTGDELPQLGAHRRTRVDLLDDRTAVRVYA